MNVSKIQIKCTPSSLMKHDYICYKDKANELKSLLTNVLNGGGSNSVLVTGPPGSGKTYLVESVISELSTNPEFASSSMVIRLSGRLCKTFMSSLEELSYQLKVQEDFINFTQTKSFNEGRTEILTFLKDTLTEGTKAKIIILDKIDLFCEHRGQALLYNLFDIARSEEKKICIIGITCNQEILELFEKRVKSRFSHRILYIKPLKFDEYREFILSLLQLENSEKWNQSMKKLLSDNQVLRVVRNLYHFDHSIRALCQFWYDVCLHCEEDSDLSPQLISDLYDEMSEGSGIQQCYDFNLVEVLLVIGILRVTAGGQTNFTIASLFEKIKAVRDVKGIEESAVRAALRNLQDYHIITPTDKSCLYYRAELDHQDLSEISNKYELPAEIKGLI